MQCSSLVASLVWPFGSLVMMFAKIAMEMLDVTIISIAEGMMREFPLKECVSLEESRLVRPSLFIHARTHLKPLFPFPFLFSLIYLTGIIPFFFS